MRAPRQRLPRGDRGDAIIQHVVLFPILLLFTFAIIQVGVYFHARNMALAAAETGVREGRIAASAQVGGQAAQDYLDQIANATFTEVTVSTTGSTITEVQVTVIGSVPSIFAGLWPLDVSQSARGPIEAPRGP